VTAQPSYDFDPRAPDGQATSKDVLQASVKDLLSVFPDSCVGQLWVTAPEPPEVGSTAEVSTSSSLQTEADQLILQLGSYTVNAKW